MPDVTPAPRSASPASPALFTWLGVSAVLFVMATTTFVGGLLVHDTESVCESRSQDVSLGECYVATNADRVWSDTVELTTLVLAAGCVACLLLAALASFSRGRSRS